MKASSAETVSFLSVSAEGSRSASTQKRANTVAFFSLPLLVAVITTRLAFSSDSAGTAARAGHVHDQLARAADAIEHRAQLDARHIGARQIDLVIVTVEAAVADQHQHERVVRLGFARHLRERILHVGFGGLRAVKRRDFGVRARSVQQLVDLLRLGCEALLVIGLAAQARHSDVERGGAN